MEQNILRVHFVGYDDRSLAPMAAFLMKHIVTENADYASVFYKPYRIVADVHYPRIPTDENLMVISSSGVHPASSRSMHTYAAYVLDGRWGMTNLYRNIVPEYLDDMVSASRNPNAKTFDKADINHHLENQDFIIAMDEKVASEIEDTIQMCYADITWPGVVTTLREFVDTPRNPEQEPYFVKESMEDSDIYSVFDPARIVGHNTEDNLRKEKKIRDKWFSTGESRAKLYVENGLKIKPSDEDAAMFVYRYASDELYTLLKKALKKIDELRPPVQIAQ